MYRVLWPIIAVAIAGEARAADMPASPENGAQHISIFSGTDLTSIGSYTGYAGATLAPFGSLEASGFRLGLFGAAGTYRYNITDGGPVRVKGTFVTGDILAGYGYERDDFSAKVYVGLNVQQQSLSPSDPTNSVQGTRAGFKVQGDFYANPTKETMIFGVASYSTAFNTYYATLKTGYDVSDGKEIFVGPEVIFQGNVRYDQWRVGAHITGIKLHEKVELDISGGYLHSSDVGHGAYGKINISFDF